MTREETIKIIRIISATYQNFKPQDLTETINAWAFLLEEYSYQEISVALKTYITSSGSDFPPSVPNLIATAKKVTNPSNLGEMEAWSLVMKAIQNSNYNSEAEFEKLPPVVQKAVGSSANLREWARTDYKSLQTVAQSNFLRSYNAEVGRTEELARIPESIRAMIEDTERKMITG